MQYVPKEKAFQLATQNVLKRLQSRRVLLQRQVERAVEDEAKTLIKSFRYDYRVLDGDILIDDADQTFWKVITVTHRVDDDGLVGVIVKTIKIRRDGSIGKRQREYDISFFQSGVVRHLLPHERKFVEECT